MAEPFERGGGVPAPWPWALFAAALVAGLVLFFVLVPG